MGRKATLRRCDLYEAEASHRSGRSWVKEQFTKGDACQLTETVVSSGLLGLPPLDPVFVLSDDGMTPSADILEKVNATLRAQFFTIKDFVADAMFASQIDDPKLVLSLELEICSKADTILLNSFSPISQTIRNKAEQKVISSRGGASVDSQEPHILVFHMADSHRCAPLFERTVRFSILPNRFGVLGQFGTMRKVQLETTDVSGLIDLNMRIQPNASVELEVFTSNVSHPLTIFEYTKFNNEKGLSVKVPTPAEGWKSFQWQTISIPIEESSYIYPKQTPWDDMDRLELYYGNGYLQQGRGDFIRIRKVYIRSSRVFGRGAQSNITNSQLTCRQIEEDRLKLIADQQGRFEHLSPDTQSSQNGMDEDLVDSGESAAETNHLRAMYVLVCLGFIAALVWYRWERSKKGEAPGKMMIC